MFSLPFGRKKGGGNNDKEAGKVKEQEKQAQQAQSEEKTENKEENNRRWVTVYIKRLESKKDKCSGVKLGFKELEEYYCVAVEGEADKLLKRGAPLVAFEFFNKKRSDAYARYYIYKEPLKGGRFRLWYVKSAGEKEGSRVFLVSYEEVEESEVERKFVEFFKGQGFNYDEGTLSELEKAYKESNIVVIAAAASAVVILAAVGFLGYEMLKPPPPPPPPAYVPPPTFSKAEQEKALIMLTRNYLDLFRKETEFVDTRYLRLDKTSITSPRATSSGASMKTSFTFQFLFPVEGGVLQRCGELSCWSKEVSREIRLRASAGTKAKLRKIHYDRSADIRCPGLLDRLGFKPYTVKPDSTAVLILKGKDPMKALNSLYEAVKACPVSVDYLSLQRGNAVVKLIYYTDLAGGNEAKGSIHH